MSYLIILFVIALALAPLSHFVPSKAQRKVARLREYAAVNGLFVEFRSSPKGRTGAPIAALEHTIYYGRRVRDRGRGPRGRLAWWVSADGWSALQSPRDVPEELAGLPEEVLAASADPGSCGVYWLETGDEAEIDQIGGVLERLEARIYQ